jgi:hypothetical protein
MPRPKNPDRITAEEENRWVVDWWTAATAGYGPEQRHKIQRQTEDILYRSREAIVRSKHLLAHCETPRDAAKT